MAPGSVGRLNGSKALISAVEHAQQRAKIDLIPSPRHLGHEITVDCSRGDGRLWRNTVGEKPGLIAPAGRQWRG